MTTSFRLGKRTDGTVLTPFMDYSNGGSLTEWIGTLEKVLQLDFDAAIPGHGPVLTKDDVRAFRQKLVTLRQRAAELIKSSVSRNDFMGKLKTDDLNWPFPKERIDHGGHRARSGKLIDRDKGHPPHSPSHEPSVPSPESRAPSPLIS